MFSSESSRPPKFCILPKSLSTGESCICEYVTLLHSFHRGTLSIKYQSETEICHRYPIKQ